MKVLEDLEVKTLYKKLLASTHPSDIFLQLLMETGARVSETLTLSSKDLVGAKLWIEPLKNSNRRRVTLSANLVAKLEALPKETPWAEALGRPGTTVKSHRRVLARYFGQLTKALFNRAVNLHTLRHTAFSRLYTKTKDLLLVKQWAGHKSVGSTMAYMHHCQEDEANAANEALLKLLAP
jgi:integrase